MSESDRLAQFCLALSYLERVQGENAHWEKLRADRQLDRTKYDEVSARYRDHLRRAQRAVDHMRRDAERALPAVETRLNAARSAQKKLAKEASAGSVDLHKLNERSREIAKSIAEYDAAAATLRLIVNAETTGDLGGGADLPLEEYPRRLDLLPKPARLFPEKLSPLQANIVAGVVMFALVLGVVVGIYWWRAAPRAEFTIGSEEVGSGFIRVECRNSGNRPLYLYVPWPGGRPEPFPGMPGGKDSFGVLLFVRIEGEREFRLFESAEDIWKLRGDYLEDSGPVEVRGGSAVRVYLDVDRLKLLGMSIEAVTLECSKRGGGERISAIVDLL